MCDVIYFCELRDEKNSDIFYEKAKNIDWFKPWKKTLEEKTFRENATCILCVNALDDIVPPIISRCQEKLPFDTGYIKGGKFVPNPAAKITKTEWTQEIFRAVRIVADKASIEVDDKTLKYIADDSVSLVDMKWACNRFVPHSSRKSLTPPSIVDDTFILFPYRL